MARAKIKTAAKRKTKAAVKRKATTKRKATAKRKAIAKSRPVVKRRAAAKPTSPAASKPTATAAPARRRAGSAKGSYRAKVRMYRHGLGDCFLVTLPTDADGKFFILIDCGVILGTPDATALMGKVMADVLATTGGKVDLLLATHEHWDHVSGFAQAKAQFDKLQVDQVWMGWTEDASDSLAKELQGGRARALAALRMSALHMQMAGDADGADEVSALLDFFGAASGPSTHDALEAVRAKAHPKPRYCNPLDPPTTLAGTDVRAYLLGPPRDAKLMKKTLPSSKDPETYGMAFGGLQALLDGGATDVSQAPFSTLFAIPLPVAREMDFFKSRYWGGPEWRRIDAAWLDDAAELALQLDSATNNTSLVLALELGDGDVLLFAADAQVGNWLSWQNLSWTVGGKAVTGPDLLKRTVFYKVGHHGSHNATLRKLGLEMMDKLGLAMIPVDEEMAKKKRWGRMPLPDLVTALTAKTGGAVLRTDDKAVPAAVAGKVDASNPLFYEVTL
ncbi:MBL fold metallo-hydrolase [Hypericibacter sp.]|uniref:MBL fold metallo-hydrolase n=1 Tax=Hypericibacter sp. TaxID=2705401 RepID=UPI003D6CC975